MVLHPRPSAQLNQMPSKSSPKSTSGNVKLMFQAAAAARPPPAKRLKYSSHDSSSIGTTEIPDSDAESGDEPLLPEAPLEQSHLTDLEQALPNIRTDKDAIREYEQMRAAEAASSPQQASSQPGQRQWIPGKSSIYVDAFNHALDTVLEDESHLFDATELQVFEDWRSLSYEAQYLYVPHSIPHDLQVLICSEVMFVFFSERRLPGIASIA